MVSWKVWFRVFGYALYLPWLARRHYQRKRASKQVADRLLALWSKSVDKAA